MTKRLKKTLIAFTVLLALIGATGTAAYASGYIEWKGSRDFREAIANLDLIHTRGQELKEERDTIASEKQQLTQELASKETLLIDKDALLATQEQELADLRAENEQLKQTSGKGKGELIQAEQDMKNVNQKTKDVLNNLR